MATTSMTTKPFYERSRRELVGDLRLFDLANPKSSYEHLAIAKTLDRLADMTEIALKKDGRFANSSLPADLHRLAGTHFGKAGLPHAAKKKGCDSSLLMQEAILHHVIAQANSMTEGAGTFAAQKRVAPLRPVQRAILDRMEAETRSLTEARVASGSISPLILLKETPVEKALVERDLRRLFPQMFTPIIPAGLLRIDQANATRVRAELYPI